MQEIFQEKIKTQKRKTKVYKDYFIMFIAVIMQMYKFSFREAIVILERIKKKITCFINFIAG